MPAPSVGQRSPTWRSLPRRRLGDLVAGGPGAGGPGGRGSATLWAGPRWLGSPGAGRPRARGSGGGAVAGLGADQARKGRLLPALDGVDDRLIEAFSSRAAQVDATLARLVGEYTDAHGYVPDHDTTARLAGQAVLMDRPDCEPRSWAAERKHWLSRAAQVLPVTPEQVGPTLVGAAIGVGRPLRTDAESREGLAEEVLDRLGERGATWNRRNIERVAAAVLREAGIRVDDTSVKLLVIAAWRAMTSRSAWRCPMSPARCPKP